jgi:acyl carrier protein
LETLKGELRQLLTELASLPEGFDEKADLYSGLGMTSMKAIEFLMALEERYGVSVPDEQFIEATSLERLAGMMRGLKNEFHADPG